MIFDKKTKNFSNVDGISGGRGSSNAGAGEKVWRGGERGSSNAGAGGRPRQRKSLGQNFIYDTGYIGAILDKLNLATTDTVVEIGVGMGTLTTELSKRVGRVIAYEIDTRLEPILREKFAPIPNIELIIADALGEFVAVGGAYKVVANIPYYITSPLIMKFLCDTNCVEICVLVQAEVADRICARVSTPEYGALSVTVQACADCALIKRVPRHMFRPVPNVSSAFVTIRKRGGDVLPVGFETFIKSVFSKRRKKISNSVDGEILTRFGINPDLRPENLTPDQFVKICRNST